MGIVFFTMIILELTYMFLLWILLKQPGTFFSEIGLGNQSEIANYMLMSNLKQLKGAV